MKKIAFCALVVLSSCQKRGMDSASMFSRSGDLKDKIACVTMIDSSFSEQSWNIADELNQYVNKEISRKDSLYVIPCGQEVSLSSSKNPFSDDVSWLNTHFSHVRFVVFTELLKYETINSSKNLTHNLEISLRVRLFEQNDQGFKPVLQEIIEHNYMLPSIANNTINLQPRYQSQGYEISPLGVAHQNFACLVAKRIRDYTKSNPQ